MRISKSVWLFAFVLVTVACDATGPEIKNDVTVTTTTSKYSLHIHPELTNIACDVNLSVVYRGKTALAWDASVIRFYLPPDFTEEFDSIPLTAAELRQRMRSDSLRPEQIISGTIQVYANLPFSARFLIRYHGLDEQVLTSNPGQVRCAPEAMTNEAPQLNILNALPATVQPGDTLTLNYTALSPNGIWFTRFLTAGGFSSAQTEYNNLLRDVRSVSQLIVPSSSSLGFPVQISIQTYDGLLRPSNTVQIASTPLVDTKPPTTSGGPGYAFVRAGSNVNMQYFARDNHIVTWTIYELDAPVLVKDSQRIAVTGASVLAEFTIATRPEWKDMILQGRTYVRDAAGNRSLPVGFTLDFR